MLPRTIDSVDVFDGEPFVGLVPKLWRQVAGLVVLVALVIWQPAREWFVHQAYEHGVHEIRPFINNLIEQTQQRQVPHRHETPTR